MTEQEFPNIYKMTFPEHAAMVMRLNLPYTAYVHGNDAAAAETWCQQTFGSRWNLDTVKGQGGVWAVGMAPWAITGNICLALLKKNIRHGLS